MWQQYSIVCLMTLTNHRHSHNIPLMKTNFTWNSFLLRTTALCNRGPFHDHHKLGLLNSGFKHFLRLFTSSDHRALYRLIPTVKKSILYKDREGVRFFLKWYREADPFSSVFKKGSYIEVFRDLQSWYAFKIRGLVERTYVHRKRTKSRAAWWWVNTTGPIFDLVNTTSRFSPFNR